MMHLRERLTLGLLAGVAGLLVLIAATPERPAPAVGRYTFHLDRSALIVFDTTTGTVYLLNTTTTNWTILPKPK